MAALRAAISVFGNVPQERDSQSVRYGLDGSRCGDASKSTERREGLKTLPYGCAADGYYCPCLAGAILLSFAGQTWVG